MPAWRLITGVMALYMCRWEHEHTHTCTDTLTQSSPLSVHMRVIFVNYHRNKNGRDQILQKWLGTACTPRLCDTARMKCCLRTSSLAAVIWVESAWCYWHGNGVLETGGGIVGIQIFTVLVAPYAAVWLTPAQSIYMLSATSKSRLNNFCVWE